MKKHTMKMLSSTTVVILMLGCSSGPEIITQDPAMSLPAASDRFEEILLPGEIPEITVHHVILKGPYTEMVVRDTAQDDIFLFIAGNGRLISADSSYEIVPESIAIPFGELKISIEAPTGEELHYLHIQKPISPEDRFQMASFPEENRAQVYFRQFKECVAYTEPIKSPNTISRTVLPKDHIARVAMGTVQATGPDEVGAHEHPMLEQLFLGLADNNVTVIADGSEEQLTEFELLHIPRGSSHGVRVETGEHMYYMWMDFFQTKEGEEWLKTHKAVQPNDSKDYRAF